MNNEFDPDVIARAAFNADKPYDQSTCERYPWAAAARIRFLEAMERKYLPTLSELIDRLSIVQLKAIFIDEHRDAYKEEIALIESDIDLLLSQRADYKLSARDIRAILGIMLTNRFIWENEAKARAGSSEQDHLLRLTHSVNGQRNTAKNILSKSFGERMDMKIDALAAELPADLGNWDLFS